MKSKYRLNPNLIDLSFDEFIPHDDDLPENVVPIKTFAPVSKNEQDVFFQNCIDMGILVKKMEIVK